MQVDGLVNKNVWEDNLFTFPTKRNMGGTNKDVLNPTLFEVLINSSHWKE